MPRVFAVLEAAKAKLEELFPVSSTHPCVFLRYMHAEYVLIKILVIVKIAEYQSFHIGLLLSKHVPVCACRARQE